MILDALYRQHHFTAYRRIRQTDVASGWIADQKVLIAKPLMYMNRSGIPVKGLINEYGFKSKDCIIIHDDMDLALGRIKIKEKGGHGGHKGIQSLIDAIGEEFIRLRVGIGRPDEGVDVVDYVLGYFKREELGMLAQVIGKAMEAAFTILCHGAKEGMNRFNSNKNQILS
jgi:PTH1 family peptidyl-tRNA hydrolase